MKKELISLQFPFYEENYTQNLKTLTTLIQKTPKESMVLAPELCLTNFSFRKMQEAANFSKEAKIKLQELSQERTIALSMTEEREGKFYNSAKIFHKGKEVHSQDKVKLFAFGDEDKYFVPGEEERVKIVEIEGIRYGMMICFEIRFLSLWQKLQGADIILIPALWGKLRKSQLEKITVAMAILNQAFVVLSDSANDDMAKSSGIITPFGKEIRNDSATYITHQADLQEVKKMRRYMDIGLR